MKVLGISCFYHDSAATLIDNGEIIYALQEERFTRVKHDSSFPKNCISFILNKTKLKLRDLDAIVFYEKPLLKFERLLETYLSFAPRGIKQFLKSMPIFLKDKVNLKKTLIENLYLCENTKIDNNKIFFSEHHLSHAASAFYPSKFKKSLILTLDAVGEWTTTSVAIGEENNITIKKKINFPHSIGLLYSAFTYYCGFKVNGGEYKLMGLAPYGKPIYKQLILDNLIKLKEDGSFILNQNYFEYCYGLKMINKKFNKLFGRESRNPDTENISEFYMDIASSIQSVTEDVILKICKHIRKEYQIENLCLAGGVALNCVANGKIHKEKIFKNIWIQPAAGDAGGSLGAALAYYYNYKNINPNLKKNSIMKGAFLGQEYSNTEIKKNLDDMKVVYIEKKFEELVQVVAKYIFDGKTIGWFQGRMEFGPRALGNRSILADPRSNIMQKELNLRIKFRESFRPFAPAVLEDKVSEWFDFEDVSPYMLMTANVKKDKLLNKDKNIKLNNKGLELLNIQNSLVPAITHVDNSARIQTVNQKDNFKFYCLINEFYKLSKVPILINTSFNIRGEPIVNTIEDAFRCFMITNLDYLVCGNFIINRNQFN